MEQTLRVVSVLAKGPLPTPSSIQSIWAHGTKDYRPRNIHLYEDEIGIINKVAAGDFSPVTNGSKVGKQQFEDTSKVLEEYVNLTEKLNREKEELQYQLSQKQKQIEEIQKELNQEKKTKSRMIHLKIGSRKTKRLKGTRHPKYEELLQLCYHRMNCLLTGPAGCGKSYIAKQVADDLGLPFYHISFSLGTTEGQILGRLLPTGTGGKFEFHSGALTNAYEKGGVLLGDELDAADPNMLVVMHAALANGTLSVPNRVKNPYAKRHKDFIFIGAANTFGRGADRIYVGRNQLDEATLDRFRIGTIEMDYDSSVAEEQESESRFDQCYAITEEFQKRIEQDKSSLESKLCPDVELRTRLTYYRTKVRENKLERIVSSRFMEHAYTMLSEANWSIGKICSKLFSGWSEDEIQLVHGR